MSSTRTDVRKRCDNCLEYVKIYLTCFQCDAVYHIYCWKNVPGAYINKTGQLFCCRGLSSSYACTNTNLESQDNPPERVVEKGNVDGSYEDLEKCLIKEEDFEWNELKCDPCLLEFTNKEHPENHSSECSNKEGEFIQELKEDKDLEKCLIKEENSELNEFKCDPCLLEFTNKEHPKNHYSECSNKERELIQELKEDKDSENCLHKEEDLEWDEFQCDACLLEFTNKELLENHYSECPNKEGEFIQELNEDKDLENYLPEKENKINSQCNEFKCDAGSSEHTNKNHLKNDYSECSNKQEGSIQGLNKDEVGLVSFSHNEENFQKESYEHHTKRCDVESGYLGLNKDNDTSATNTKRNLAQGDDKEKYKCIHNDEKPFSYNMCDYVTKVSETLKSHFSSKHYDGKEKYESRVCRFSTPSENAFERPPQIHSSELLFKCDWCDYVTAYKGVLNGHIKFKHSKVQKQYKCKECEYSTYRKETLVRHIRTHTNEKPFKCDICDYAAAEKATLKWHVLVKHSNVEKMYKCTVCKYSSHRKTGLFNHMRIHIPLPYFNKTS